LTSLSRPTAKEVKRPYRPRLADVLGPGLITGASDDDPSGIATYSQAGAQFGLSLIWTLLLTYPLMCAIQMISAQIGRATGMGLAGNMRKHYPLALLYGLVGLLLLANVINIGADLGAMGAALRLLLPGPQWLYIAALAALTIVLEVFTRYARYASVLRWLTLSLFAYVGTVFVVGVPWSRVAADPVVPHIQGTGSYLTVVVAVFGTTISSYLFFWQAAAEVEDQREDPAADALLKAPRQAPRQLARIQLDTIVGMGLSNLIALFIVLTTAATLNAHGVANIETSSQAAEALRPIAGEFAFTIFALGIVGTGLLAVPVLAGSAAQWPGRSVQMASGLGPTRRPGAGILSGDRRRHAGRRSHELFAARSDQGALLERRHQWRRRRSDPGDDHAHGLASKGHGRVRPWAMAQRTWVARDRCDGDRRDSNVSHMGRLNVGWEKFFPPCADLQTVTDEHGASWRHPIRAQTHFGGRHAQQLFSRSSAHFGFSGSLLHSGRSDQRFCCGRRSQCAGARAGSGSLDRR
jgi:Mn2+/Fe2+ NRAMP family transporter